MNILKGLSTKDMHKNFNLEVGPVSHSPDYTDWEFSDKSEKSASRLWVLTRDESNGSFYATLRRSKTPDGDFGYEVKVSRKMTLALAFPIIFENLIT